MNKHASTFMEYFQTLPEPKTPPPVKQAQPPEPHDDLNRARCANMLYMVFEHLKEQEAESWVLEDLLDCIEMLVPGYLATEST